MADNLSRRLRDPRYPDSTQQYGPEITGENLKLPHEGVDQVQAEQRGRQEVQDVHTCDAGGPGRCRKGTIWYAANVLHTWGATVKACKALSQTSM